MRLYDCVVCFTAVISLFMIAHLPSNASEQYDRKVVVPFDFESKFDNGHYGQIVGDMIWTKLDRENRVIVPETMLDIRDFCQTHRLKISPETSLERVGKIVKGGFAAQVAIWGAVERVPGHDSDVYNFSIICVDFSRTPPKIIYDKRNVRTKTANEIPRVYVRKMLEKLYDHSPVATSPKSPAEEKNWENGPNLIVGDFERGRGNVPTGWDEVGGHEREPLGGVVKWLPEAGNPLNHLIQFTLSEKIGNTTGILYYSDFFPVHEGAKYRFQCRWKTSGPLVKVFVKCYDGMTSEYTNGRLSHPEVSGGGKNRGKRLAKNVYAPKKSQRREVYRNQQNLYGTNNTWHTQTEDFTPKHSKYTPRWGRVMLYAHVGFGTVEFDDIVIKQIRPASLAKGAKNLRHSSASNVTVKDMKQHERLGLELRNRRKIEHGKKNR